MKEGTSKQRLQEELMLQINDRLFRQGIIPEQLYEQAKIKIVDHCRK